VIESRSFVAIKSERMFQTHIKVTRDLLRKTEPNSWVRISRMLNSSRDNRICRRVLKDNLEDTL
jgi:hypothetical protein